ncbi:MAG TPA: hypothetical protein VG406_22235, partial [Isosphaeraceae bacterium]|nr:hypothetical protein [Isosphaeraceae bacterium]
MRTRLPSRTVGLMSTATVFVAVWGCGDSAPSTDTSSTPATVSGTITLKGKPATQGKVTFNPANVNRKTVPSATVDIGKDGSYKVSTLTGENTVTVDTPELRKNPTEL